MENCFKKVREKIRLIEEEKAPISSSFEGALFSGTPWFLSKFPSPRFKIDDLRVTPPQECYFEDTIQEELEPGPKKVEMLESLYDYVEDKIDQNVQEGKESSLKFKGGEITLKDRVPGDEYLESVVEYDEDICSKCLSMAKSEIIGKVRPQISCDHSGDLQVLFVGDSPRLSEDKSLSLFSPAVSDLLSRMATAMQFSEDQYGMSLLVKCFHVSEEDQDNCSTHCLNNLFKEILELRPKVVVALGARVVNFLLERKERLSIVHGKFFTKKLIDKSGDEFEFKIVPIFHPDFLLINPKMKRTTWNDLQGVIKYLDELKQ